LIFYAYGFRASNRAVRRGGGGSWLDGATIHIGCTNETEYRIQGEMSGRMKTLTEKA
jgi:hypothetical protein